MFANLFLWYFSLKTIIFFLWFPLLLLIDSCSPLCVFPVDHAVELRQGYQASTRLQIEKDNSRIKVKLHIETTVTLLVQGGPLKMYSFKICLL